MKWLAGWIRIALLDLKGDLRHFGVLLACLALGTCTIAAVGSVGAALQTAIVRDASKLMGGDLEASRSDRRANPDEIAYLKTFGQLAEVDESNGRAATPDGSAFLDLMAVDDNYPLLGRVESPQLQPGEKPGDLLGPENGIYGALVDPIVLDRLGIKLGGTFKIGAVAYQARGTIASLPDGAARGFHLGLLTVISVEALANTPDARPPLPGMLTQYRYKIVLAPGTSYDEASKAILAHFDDPRHWQTRSPRDAAGTLARYYDLFTRFLLIVGLSALLVGGVGVSNAVSAYISERQRSVATMRSLGATSARIFVHFVVQLGILSLVGVGIGITLGAISTAVALPFLGEILQVDLPPSVNVPALLTAAGFGFLVAFGFSFLPIVRAQRLKPAMLFRSVGSEAARLDARQTLRPQVVLPLAVTAALVFLLAVVTTNDLYMVSFYAVGVVLAFLLLRFAGLGLQLLLRLMPPLPNTDLRNAFKSIVRPGSPAPVVIMSIGLGLAMLLVIALLDNNLRSQLQGEVTRDAPSFVVFDLFPDEVVDLKKYSEENKNIVGFNTAPTFRGEVVEINGRPAADFKKAGEEVAFLVGGAIPMTWAGDLPPKSTVAAGKWWGPDYKGPPLVSLRTSTAALLKLHVGDTMTFNLYGQTIEAKVANLRDYQWQSGGLNFMVTFSPHALDGLPGADMVGLKAAPGKDKIVERELARDFPVLTFLPIGDFLSQAADIIDKLSLAVDIVGGLAVINGLLVLAGTMAAGRKQRESDAVIVKVLGATRGDVVRAFVLEYGVLGAFSALLAAIIGIAAAWAITIKALEVSYNVDVPLILYVVIGTVVATIATGAATTWGALSTRPAQYLRSE